MAHKSAGFERLRIGVGFEARQEKRILFFGFETVTYRSVRFPK
jgi:hypothetical protein